jgi:trigger factor
MPESRRQERTDPEEAAAVAEPPQMITEAESGTAVVDVPDTEAAEESAKLNQIVEATDIGPCKKHVKVSVDEADIKRLIDDKYSKMVVETQVPGFRPGKAPRKMIERRYQKDVMEQVRAEVLLQSLEQLDEDSKLSPLAPPDINPAKITLPEQGPLIYEFDIEVRPEFELPDYRGLKLKRPIRDFTDADVAEEERRALAPYGQLVPKPEGNAQVGDYLISNLTTRYGDRILGTLKEVTIRIDPRLALKDGVAEQFANQVKGVSAGESRIVDITLSDAVADADLRGKTVQTAFEVQDVKKMRLPELTHEFLHNFNVHSVEQLHERIRVMLNRRLEYYQRQSARQQVLELLTADSKWDLPQDLLVRQARRSFQRRVMEMRSAGMSEDEIRGRQRLLEQDVVRSTSLALKEHFVLQKIAELENLDVDDAEIEDEIERIAMQNDESPRRVRARLDKEDMIEALAIEMIERKALDLILNSATYEDTPLVQEEGAVATVEQQAVEGELKDPTAPPPEEKKEEKEEAETKE